MVVLMKGYCVESTLIMMLLSVTSLESVDNGDVDCGGINHEIFNTLLCSTGIRDDLLPYLNNQHCYCKKPDEVIDKFAAISPVECYPCDEDPVKCKIYGTCCSSRIFQNTASLVVQKYSSHPEDGLAESKLDCHNGYLIVKSCPGGFHDNRTRSLCEVELPSNETTMATFTIVTDESTKVSYSNRYCAECNNVQKMREWLLTMKFETYFYVREALNELEMLRLSMNQGSQCIISQHPDGIKPYTCDSRYFSPPGHPYGSGCNHWKQEYEQSSSGRLEDMCRTMPEDHRTRVASRRASFKNIYCLMCNKKVHCGKHPIDTNEGVHDIVNQRPPPFQYMFGLGSAGFLIGPNPKDVPGCPKNQWKDPRGKCRQVICTKGKVLEENHCATAMRQINGLPYKMGLLLTHVGHRNHLESNTTVGPDKRTSITFVDEIKNQLLPLLVMLQIDLYMTDFAAIDIPQEGKDNTQTDRFVLPQFISVNLYLLAFQNDSYSRDAVENKILDFFHNPVFEVDLKDHDNVSVKYQPLIQHWHSDDCTSKVNCIHERSEIINDMDMLDSYEYSYLQYDLVKRSDFIDVFPYLRCPYIKLSAEEVHETTRPWPFAHTSKLVLDFGFDITVEISDKFEMSHIYREEDGMFCVCLELLESKFPPVSTVLTSNSLLDIVQHILTGMCVSASVVCLFATVITYCLFQSLRCVAGCNTLGLSASLSIAQILLLVGNATPGPSVMCTAIGLISHYSWLVMFTWTFLCCLHMLRVFTSTQRQSTTSRSGSTRRSRDEKNAIALNVALSFSLPALVVVTIVVTNVFLYDVTVIGYGSYSCAVDNVYTIHGPLLFVTVCNILFFVIVVCKIWGVRRLQQTDDFNKDFIVYIKLSTLTGMFWLLVILGEVFQNDVIRCLAIVSNGCQGVFIFASFVANRRVLKHYAEKFNLTWLSSLEASSSVGSSTRTNVEIAPRDSERPASATKFDCDVTGGDKF